MEQTNTQIKHVTGDSNIINANVKYIGDTSLNQNDTLLTTEGGTNGITRILKRKEVLRIVGISSAQLYRNIKAGLFPSPYSLGEKAVGWKESDIVAWLNGLRSTNSISEAEIN